MNELTASNESGVSLLPALLEWGLISTGIVAALVLGIYHRRHPPARRTLTAQLAARSWNTKPLGLVFGILILLYFLASFTGRFFYEDQIPLAQLLITLAIYATVMILIAFISRKRGDSWETAYGAGRLKKAALAPVFYLALLPVLALITKAYHLLLQYVFGMEIELQEAAQVIRQDFSWLQLLYAMTAIFIAPLYEELLFRGLLLPYLVKRGGLAIGTLLVSVVFAAMHSHGPSFVPLFLLSCALCLAYWRTGSLWVCIVMHMIFNAVTILALNAAG